MLFFFSIKTKQHLTTEEKFRVFLWSAYHYIIKGARYQFLKIPLKSALLSLFGKMKAGKYHYQVCFVNNF